MQDLEINDILLDKAFSSVLLGEMGEAGVYLSSINLIEIQKTLPECRGAAGVELIIEQFLDFVEGQGELPYLADSMVSTLQGVYGEAVSNKWIP